MSCKEADLLWENIPTKTRRWSAWSHELIAMARCHIARPGLRTEHDCGGEMAVWLAANDPDRDPTLTLSGPETV